MAGIIALALALFAGKFSFDRFLVETSRIAWLELRLWGMFIACVCGIVLLRREGWRSVSAERGVRYYAAAVIVLYLYLAGNAVLLGNDAGKTQHLADLSYLVLGVLWIVLFFRGTRDILTLAYLVEGVGIILFLLALAGFGNPTVNNAGWAPFGGPITFNRIQFLSFCSALYLHARSDRVPGRGVHLVIAGIGLFSALASLQKIVLAGALLVILYFLFWQLSTRSYHQAGALSMLLVIVLPCYAAYQGEKMAERLDRGATAAVVLLDMDMTEVYAPDVRFSDLTNEQQQKIVNIRSLLTGTVPDYRSDLPGFLRSSMKLTVVNDSTDRVKMAQRALTVYSNSNKWFGAGIGNYSFASVNIRSLELETYRYPHNILLELLCLSGIVGLFLFGVAVFIGAVLLQRLVHAEPHSMFFFGYAGYIAVTSLTGGDFYDFRLFFCVTLMVLAASQAAFLQRPEAETASSSPAG